MPSPGSIVVSSLPCGNDTFSRGPYERRHVRGTDLVYSVE